MIVLTVHSFNGAPCEPLSASFDELGGTIGRGPANQLVLPDPERSVSRVHAQILYRNGGYTVADQGSNPIQVNGRAAAGGRELALADGDEVQIGGYLLKVSFGQAAAAPDPFADLFGAADPVFGKAAAPAPAPPRPPPAAPPSTWAAGLPAPAFASGRAPVSAPPPRPAPAAPLRAGGGIPDDWDPFASDAGPSAVDLGRPPAGAAAGGSAGFGDLPLSPPSRQDSLDAMFGLGPAQAGASDPFAALPKAASALAQPNTAADADPLRALMSSAAPTAPPQADHGSELNTPWPSAAAPPAALPSGAVLSWNSPSRDAKVVTLPGLPPVAAPADEPQDRTQIVLGTRPAGARRAPTPPTPPTPSAGLAAQAPAASVATPAPAPGSDALLTALLSGLGLPELRVDRLGVEQMQLLGQLLREATRGAVELLVARAALKREMRADVTMIAARENNPLKFSPNVEAALQHLLGPATPGFMAPAEAMRDAFDDLRAHQLATLAGMRSALAGVLARFDPAVLEGKLVRRGALSGLLAGSRKAQLWEQFQALYSQLSAEAADDFQELFGKAFRLAYEAHIDELQRGKP